MSYSGHLQISSHLAEQEILTLWILFFFLSLAAFAFLISKKSYKV